MSLQSQPSSQPSSQSSSQQSSQSQKSPQFFKRPPQFRTKFAASFNCTQLASNFALLTALIGIITVSPFSAKMASAADKQVVAVSLAPQKYFVERIAGDAVNVLVMAPAGTDPHNYEPRPRQMVRLAKAKLYLAIGVEFERDWLGRFSSINPDMRVVHTNVGIPKLPGVAHALEKGVAQAHEEDADQTDREKHDDDRDHGETEHSLTGPDVIGQEGGDPHIWLSPLLVKIQALHILDALLAMDTAGTHAAKYRAGYVKFQTELDELHRKMKTLVPAKTGSADSSAAFLTLHPVWGYLAHELGLHQMSIEIEGKEPKPAQLQHLITEARSHNIRAIFIQPQRPRRAAEILARELGAKLITIDPLTEDWNANLLKAAGQIGEVLK